MRLVEEDDDLLERLSAQRGISYPTLDNAGIGFETGGYRQGWFTIPYPHRSGIWKTRFYNPNPESGNRYLDDPGAKFHLYNPLLLGPGEAEVWFCEGEFDTLALIDQGLNVIGIHGVSNVKSKSETDKDSDEEKEGRFRKSWQHLFADTLCIVMFDNDDAGRPAGRQLSRFLGGEVFDDWDDKYGDCNDWHKDEPGGLGRAVSRFRSRIYRSRGLESGW